MATPFYTTRKQDDKGNWFSVLYYVVNINTVKQAGAFEIIHNAPKGATLDYEDAIIREYAKYLSRVKSGADKGIFTKSPSNHIRQVGFDNRTIGAVYPWVYNADREFERMEREITDAFKDYYQYVCEYFRQQGKR